MFSKIKNDLPAGLVVFLVALPLCLGVALASGAPLLSGVISGIIGGIVVGLLSESHTSVSGPAAGLAAVVLASITKLGSFEVFLLAVVLSGVIQLILGIVKGGFIANYIPSNVIKGLLAAIGIILILKQIPHAVGFDRDTEGDFVFAQSDGENTFSELLNLFSYFSWGAIIISAFSIFIMLNWDKTPMKKIKFFPASLFVVLSGIFLNFIFKTYFPALYISTEHLVKIPPIDSVSSLITMPAFGSIYNPNVWIIAFTIAIVASLETLLNLEAVENIDPYKRQASPNRELVAQGIGNILSGMIGGIPITSVIVRSSANINAGAETKLSAILHGMLLAVSILLLSPFLNLIPLAALASILLLTGYKLAKVSIFIDMYKKGQNQFIPFVATVVAIVFTDLLMGVMIGLAISIFYLLKNNYSNPFVLEQETLQIDEAIRLKLPNQVTFLNKASIKTTLWAFPENSKVIIDATYCDFIDNDVLEIIDQYQTTISVQKSIQLKVLGLKQHYNWEEPMQYVNV
jgi:carbonic anhydrase/SulP family sulfate permease